MARSSGRPAWLSAPLLAAVFGLSAAAEPPAPRRTDPPPPSADLLQYLGEFEDDAGQPLDPADLADSTLPPPGQDTPHDDPDAKHVQAPPPGRRRQR